MPHKRKRHNFQTPSLPPKRKVKREPERETRKAWKNYVYTHEKGEHIIKKGQKKNTCFCLTLRIRRVGYLVLCVPAARTQKIPRTKTKTTFWCWIITQTQNQSEKPFVCVCWWFVCSQEQGNHFLAAGFIVLLLVRVCVYIYLTWFFMSSRSRLAFYRRHLLAAWKVVGKPEKEML